MSPRPWTTHEYAGHCLCMYVLTGVVLHPTSGGPPIVSSANKCPTSYFMCNGTYVTNNMLRYPLPQPFLLLAAADVIRTFAEAAFAVFKSLSLLAGCSGPPASASAPFPAQQETAG